VAIIFGGKVQQIGTIDEVSRTPKNYDIAKILGIRNIWGVRAESLSPQITRVESSLATFVVCRENLHAMSGLLIPPDVVEISPIAEDKIRDDDHSKNEGDVCNLAASEDEAMEFSGLIQSIHRSPNEVLVLIVKILDSHTEFLRVQKSASLPTPAPDDEVRFVQGQKVGLKIWKKDIVFF